MKQLDMFDEARSRVERDAAIKRVAGNTPLDWWPRACAVVAQLRNWSGTGEDIRILVRALVGDPHSQNAWGALVAQSIRSKWIAPTGERCAMRSVRSHARQTDIYRSR